MTPITNLMAPSTSFATGPNQPDSVSGLSAKQVESVGTEFEGVFLSMMLKEMRKSLDEGGFFTGESSDTYGGMFDLFIGQHLAESQPLGIGKMLVEQYQRVSTAQTPASENQSTSWSA